ncbi:MAG: GntR family transcriptional regulator, partial [Oscillospiraceae bacterium]|nr:GntR family transcriptional regulator [Oscillospiraceae bacterium]
IQRAYKELEAEGYIYSAAGKGSFAAPMSETTSMKKKELFAELNKTLAELFELGVSEAELIEHIKEVKK